MLKNKKISWILLKSNQNSSFHLHNFDSTGKAEAGSAGEQPARNNLFDWNGQRLKETSTSFFI
jgi:hypothetical protein